MSSAAHPAVRIVVDDLAGSLAELVGDGALPNAPDDLSVLTEALDLIRASAFGERVVASGADGVGDVAAAVDGPLRRVRPDLADIVAGHLAVAGELLREDPADVGHLLGDVARGHVLGVAESVDLAVTGDGPAGDAVLSGRVRTEHPWRLLDVVVVRSGGTRFAVPTFRAGVGATTQPGGDARDLRLDRVLVPGHDRFAAAVAG